MRTLTIALFAAILTVGIGCTNDFLSGNADKSSMTLSTGEKGAAAPSQGKMRHPQLLDQAISASSTTVAGKYAAQNAHLFIAFAEYEADGVTRRVLDQYGITRRILTEYGVTRRVLEEYGVTRRILEEYGITRRIMEEYDGLTWELLDAYGITRRILDEYGVTRRVLEEYAETYEPAIDVRVRINLARPGVTIVFVADFLETFLDEIADDPDIELIEPDVELEGAPLYLREGFQHDDEMVPWGLSKVGGLFPAFEKDAVEVFLLDSGIYDRDLNVVEAKDFTMLFANRNEETWDDSQVIEMPFFDPGEMGDPGDRNGHGTHGAGTIGAKNNGEGIRGMAPEARIHSLKVLTDDGRTDITTVVSAIDYVTDYKQQDPTRPVVMNLSLGMDIESTAYNILDEAVKRASDFGVVVVVSAGNDGSDASTYSPAHVFEAITVGAYDRNDQFASFSNHGTVVDLLAPGDAVVSLTHLESEADNDDNVVISGTSSAAPHVTAAAALYLAMYPYASPAEVKQALINDSVARIEGVPGGTTNRTVYVAFASDGDTKPFRVTKAEWKSDSHQLKIEGEGPRLDTVTIFNAARETELATLIVLESGSWKYNVTEPDQIPCFVDVTHEDASGELHTERHEVLYAPGSCDPLLQLTKAEWKDNDNELIVEGNAVAGSTVTLTDTQLGTELASVVVENDRKFLFESTQFSQAPCRVTATVGDQTAELDVKDADEDECSGGSGLITRISISKAEYDSDKKKLKIEGDSNGDSEVTIRSVASGNVVGTVTASGSGRFKYEEQDPPIIPCSIQAISSSDGSTAVMAVIKKGTENPPSDCERSLILENVEWNESGQKLKLQGRGLYYHTVVFRNARNGEVFHTATIDNKGKFNDEVPGLQFIPCSITAESEEATLVTLSSEIENQAYNCDRNLVMNLARFTPAYNRLSVGGSATPGTLVSLVNPDNGTSITQTGVSSDGTWRADLDIVESGSVPPCRIQASATNGDVQIAEVSAGQCDTSFEFVQSEQAVEQNAYSFIELSKTEWQAATQSLVVQGNGYEFMEITVTNPYNGDVLGSFANDDTPAFAFTLAIPGVVPCEIIAELDQRIAERAVNNAPQNCDDQPFMASARWDDDMLTVTALGGKDTPYTLASSTRGLFASGSFTSQGSLVEAYDASNLEWIPCAVELASNQASVSLPVNGAPDHCDGVPDILLSKWSGGQLMLSAWGGFGASITVSSSGTGDVVASGQFDSNGMFSVAVATSDLDYVPCSTEFETEGMSASHPVASLPESCDGVPDVSLAQWNNGNFNFRATGGFGQDFQLFSTQRPELVYASAFDEAGETDLVLSGDDGLPFVPSELRVEYRTRQDRPFEALTMPVQNAPGHADGDISIEGVEWANGALEIEAWGPYNGTLTISSAGNGLMVGSITLDEVGYFESEVTGLEFVPCTVRMTTADGRTAEMLVNHAPLTCDDRAWLDFGKAEWDAGHTELVLQGDGLGRGEDEFAMVSFFYASGVQDAAFVTVAMDDGEWNLEHSMDRDVVPCAVTVRLQNAEEQVLPVDRAPGNCR